MSVERRRYPRHEVMAQIRVKRGTINYIMSVRNISRGGMFITASELKKLPQFRVGQTLEVDLFFVNDLENVRVNGTIVRLANDAKGSAIGFGVEIREAFDEQSFETIIKAAKNAPPPLPGQRVHQ